MPDIPVDSSRLDELAESFAEQYRRGERPSLTQYISDHPDLADQIRELFPALVMMEQVDQDLQRPSGCVPIAQSPESPLTQLGDFRIIREVGRGGMGVVYEAEQVSLGRRVALKVLPRHLLTNEKHAKRFDREARAAARLHHTNIVPVFGVGEQEGVHYYVMQFIHGLGLDEVLVELKRLRDESAAARFGQAATAREPVAAQPVAAGHEKVVAHVAHSLLTGQFEKTVLVDGSGAEDGGQKSETGAGGRGGTERSAESPGERRTAPEAGKRVAADTTLAQFADTAVSSGVFALPGQSERSKVQSQQVYWQSVARIGAQAADALQYAHDQGIIHRDIKPGNLLLDARGSVWVTDFGLAKAADQQDLTHTGDLLGTLRYMAPEQFDGKADARSDVYALGLTLYELLALQPGFDETDRRKLIKQVTTGAPVRLRLVEPRIPRDLETIVHKAIERDPAQRYSTAGDLAADLQRYLGDEPIRARRISPLTRFTRWCKRNPVVASLTSAIAVLITTAAVVASVAAVRFEKLAEHNGQLAGKLKGALGDAEQNLTLANTETKRAEAALAQVQSEQQRAEGNLDLALTALDAVYLDAIGTEKLMGQQRNRPQAGEADFSPSANAPLTDLEKELLKRGLTFYDQFAQQNSGTPRAAVQTAQAHFRVGLLQGALGDNAAAESAYRAAIERFELLVKEEPNNVEYHRRLAQSYSGLSRTIADWNIAKPFVERSIDSYTTAIQLSPDNAELYAARGWENGTAGRPVEQRHDLLKAADLAPDNLEHQQEAANVLHWVDPVQGRRYAERALRLAPESSTAALAMAFTFPAGDPEHLKYLNLAIERDPKSDWTWLRRAKAHIWRGENELALADAQKAVELAPNNFNALTELGRALVNLKRLGEAEQSLDRALSINPHFWITFAVLGELKNSQGQYDKAVEVLSHAIELNPPAHWLYKRRAEAFFSLERFPEALADLTQALTLRPQDTSTLVWLGLAAIAQCPDEAFKEGLLKLADQVVDNTERHPTRLYRIVLSLAFEDYDKARRDFEMLPPPDTSDYRGQYQHALLCVRLQDQAGYRSRCRNMVERFADTVDLNAANEVAWTCALGPQALDDYAPVVALARKAVDGQPDNHGYLNTLGAILFRAGRHQDALQTLSKGIALRGTAEVHDAIYLAMIHQQLGNTEEAQDSLKRAKELNAQQRGGPWNYWLEVEFLLREASASVLDDAPKAAPESNSSQNTD